LTYAQRDVIQRNFSPSRSRGLKNIELAVPIEEVTINRNNKTSRDPYYWAPFVVIGNGFIK
jgi:CHAT domain-containing protein